MKSRVLLFVLLFLFTASFAHADLLSNGSFETTTWTESDFASHYFMYNPSDSAWTFSAGSGVAVNEIGVYWNANAYDGTKYAFLQGCGYTISQTFTLGTNSDLELSFWAADRWLYGNYHQNFQVLIDGAVAGTYDLTASTTVYINCVIDLLGVSAGQHTLSFKGLGDGDGADVAAFIDLVSLTITASNDDPVSTPEPATMLLLGLGLVGLAGARRLRK